MQYSRSELLGASVGLLRELPRRREDIEHARAQVDGLRRAYPGTRIDLSVDRPPGAAAVDYDLLLDDGEGGTIAVCWRADRGQPWSVEYGDHWAANYVVSVNDRDISIQQALLDLRIAAGQTPSLSEQIIDSALIVIAIEKDPPPVAAHELQQMADLLRRWLGLYSAAATHAWLEELGISTLRLEHIVKRMVQRRKLVDRVVASRTQAYFRDNHSRFEKIHVVRVDVAEQAAAAELAASAGIHGLLGAVDEYARTSTEAHVNAGLECCFAGDLPNGAEAARVGTITGPLRIQGGYRLMEVLRRSTACLDQRTRAAIRARIWREWLDEQRAGARIRWHWVE